MIPNFSVSFSLLDNCGINTIYMIFKDHKVLSTDQSYLMWDFAIIYSIRCVCGGGGFHFKLKYTTSPKSCQGSIFQMFGATESLWGVVVRVSA